MLSATELTKKRREEEEQAQRLGTVNAAHRCHC